MKNTINKIMIGIILISITTGTSITALANSKTNYSLNQDTTKTINENNFLTNNVDKNHEYQGIPAGTHGVLLMSKSDFNINNYSQIEMTSFKGVSNGNDVNVTDPNMLIPKSNIMQSFKSGSSSINGNTRVFPSYKYKSSFFRYKTVPGFSLKIVNGVLNFWLTPIFTKINDFSIVFTPISQIPLTPSFRKQTPLSPSFHKQSPLTPSINNKWKNENYFVDKDVAVSYTYQTKDGTIWVGTSCWYSSTPTALKKTKLYKSIDNGKTWSPIDGFMGSEVLSIFQTNDGTIWVGGQLSGPNRESSLFKSTNNGSTWNSVSEFKNSSIFSIYQTADSVIWIGSNQEKPLETSHDGGKNWENVSFFNGEDVNVNATYQTKDGTIWVGGTYLCENRKYSLYKSTDNGKTWTHAEGGFPQHVVVINQITQMSDGDIWIAMSDEKTESNVYKSADNGKTWSEVKEFHGDTGNSGASNIIETYDGKILAGGRFFNSDYTSTINSLCISDDGGKTWKRNSFFYTVTSLFESKDNKVWLGGNLGSNFDGKHQYPWSLFYAQFKV